MIKAYEVIEREEGRGAVVFATNSATARREGASEIGVEWEDIETCRRAPHLDQYAPGPVSPLVLIEHGWWFECMHCSRRVSNDMADDLECDGLNPDDFIPREAGSHFVFCSEGCECAHHMQQRNRDEAADALREVFEASFPGADSHHLYVSDVPTLNGKCCVTFSFPGGKNSVEWHFGNEFVKVSREDVGAWNAWRGKPTHQEEVAA